MTYRQARANNWDTTVKDYWRPNNFELGDDIRLNNTEHYWYVLAGLLPSCYRTNLRTMGYINNDIWEKHCGAIREKNYTNTSSAPWR